MELDAIRKKNNCDFMIICLTALTVGIVILGAGVSYAHLNDVEEANQKRTTVVASTHLI